MSNGDKFICHLCPVVSARDTAGAQRIKVRMPGTDEVDEKKVPVEELPYCFPLLPKMLHITPKVGEMVMVFTQMINDMKGTRYYIGPVTLQDYTMYFTPANAIDPSTLGHKDMGPFQNPNQIPDNEGTLPAKEDIAIRGRNNTDLVLKDNEVRLRCGFKKYGNEPEKFPVETRLGFNETDPAYIQMKYRDAKDEKKKDYRSSVNIVGDRINLLSHDSRTAFPLADRQDLISDETMSNILAKAHALPYGDLLVDFLNEFIRVFKTHTHPFHQEPPCLNQTDEDAISKDLTQLLSQSIKIN